jgi:hypothetical protein
LKIKGAGTFIGENTVRKTQGMHQINRLGKVNLLFQGTAAENGAAKLNSALGSNLT